MKPHYLLSLLAALAAGAHAGSPGEAVYQSACMACHGERGAGIPGLAPPLAGSLGRQLAAPLARDYLTHLLLAGMSGRIRVDGQVYNGIMPPQAAMKDADLAAVMTYVAAELNPGAPALVVEANDVAKARGTPMKPSQVHGLRQKLMGE
ncbi:MAG: cytochrome c [Cupriavidus sp.]|nr:cytochrome c [Cupriavidus sp.]